MKQYLLRAKPAILAALLAFTVVSVAGEIDQLSTTDASNTTRFPENMAPSAVNNGMRSLEAILARYTNDINGSLIAYGNSGAPNAIKVTPNRAVISLYDGFSLSFTATFANTGAATLQVATQSAVTIKKLHDQDLVSGDVEIGQRLVVAYSASEAVFHLLSPVANAPLSASSVLDDISDVDLTGKAVSEVLAFAGGSGNWISRSISDLGGRTQGRSTIWVPAGAMVARTSTGAAPGTTESTTNKVMLKTLDFDRDTNEFAQFLIAMPTDWNRSTVSFIPYWTSTNSTGVVLWQLQGLALRDDDAVDTAFGATAVVSDTALGVRDLMIGTESAAITLGGTVGTGSLVIYQVSRDAVDATDTSLVDAGLIGIKIIYTTNAANDN